MKLPVAPGLALSLSAVVVTSVSGALLGIEVALLVAAGFSLLLVILFVWTSVQGLAGDSPLTLEEALTLGQPSAEEEQKRALLRALKDLEYERSVGKISESDYAELSARYREEAKRLIQLVDESLTPARERAERLVKERLAREAGERAAKQRSSEERAKGDGAGEDEPDSVAQSEPPVSNGRSAADEEERA